MKIAYFVNSFNSINWGGQATSFGIKKLVNDNYPDSEFTPITLPSFPMKKIKIIRSFWEKKLAYAILEDNESKILFYLSKLNIKEPFFNEFDTVCFNGEGAIHSKSGHLIRLMGILVMFKKKGAYVSALNQTVDLGDNILLKKLVKKVYSQVDFLAVREPVSQRELNSLDLYPEVIGDAAYALDRLKKIEIEELVSDLELPKKFIVITGSSYLSRDKQSINLMEALICDIKRNYNSIPLYFLANTKTDIYLANKLISKFKYKIFASPEKYDKAMAVISKAYLVVGGRQHPNIFAAKYSVPFIPLKGNTHKMEGVVELLNYPINVLSWGDSRSLKNEVDKIEIIRTNLYDNVKVPVIKKIKLK